MSEDQPSKEDGQTGSEPSKTRVRSKLPPVRKKESEPRYESTKSRKNKSPNPEDEDWLNDPKPLAKTGKIEPFSTNLSTETPPSFLLEFDDTPQTPPASPLSLFFFPIPFAKSFNTRIRVAFNKKINEEFPSAPPYLISGVFFIALVVFSLLIFAAIRAATSPTSPDSTSRSPLASETTGTSPESLDPSIYSPENQRNTFKIVEQYIASDGWRKKLDYVRRPEATGPLMEAWYSNPKRVGDDRAKKMGPVIFTNKVIQSGSEYIILQCEILPERNTAFFAVHKSRDGQYEIDWEASAHYQEMEIEDFKAQQPIRPVTFRVQAELSDYYNFQFDDPEKYIALALSNPYYPDFNLYAYVERDSPVATGVISRFSNRQQLRSISLIVKLRYPETGANPDQVILEEIVQDGWGIND